MNAAYRVGTEEWNSRRIVGTVELVVSASDKNVGHVARPSTTPYRLKGSNLVQMYSGPVHRLELSK